MVRIIGLIFVFGIASLCLASFIHVSVAYAQPRQVCPCSDAEYGYPTLEDVLGDPKSPTLLLQICDTNAEEPEPCPDPTGRRCTLHVQEVEIKSFDESPNSFGAYVRRYVPNQYGGNAPFCQIYNETKGIDNRVAQIYPSQARLCIHDIVTYCREYCRYHTNPLCQ